MVQERYERAFIGYNIEAKFSFSSKDAKIGTYTVLHILENGNREYNTEVVERYHEEYIGKTLDEIVDMKINGLKEKYPDIHEEYS